MKISTIIENMKKYHKGYGTIDEEKTRDKVLYGNVDQECTGIVTSCWASVDVIEYAIEKGANLIISHEALFWNHGDHQEWLEESKNSVYLEKRKLLDDHQIVVWRDHDYIHSGIPYKGDYIDGIFLGLAKKMGWEDKLIVNPINEFEPSLLCSTAYSFDHSIKAKDLAKELIDTCHLNGIKLIGNSNADIKKAAVLFHVFGDANEAIKNTDKSDVDCLLSMELIDFTYAEYLRDSGMLGRNRVALGMGHFNLEEPGMEYMLEYLDEAIGEHIPAWFKQSGDNYEYMTKDCCHEALFWNHGDHQEWLEESKNSVYLEKRKLLDDHQIVVWRDHDYIHSGIPYKGDYIDGIFLGLAKKMGWEDKLIVNPINEFEPSLLCSTAYSFDHSIKAKDLAKELIDTCHLNGIKLIGNSNADIKKAAVLFHVFGDANEAIKNTDKSDVDCLLSMELIDFTYAEYLRDSGMLGRNRVALGMGHFNLEEPGMEYMLEYLDEAIGEHIPAWFKQSGDNYEYMTKDCCHDH